MGPLRSRASAVELLGESALGRGGSKHFRLAPQAQASSWGAARLDARSASCAHGLAVAGGEAERGRFPFVADDGHRQRPALPGSADHT